MPTTNSPEESDVIIQKVPSDIGIHRTPRKGTLNAPKNIMQDLEFEKTVFVEEIFTDEFDLEATQEDLYQSTQDLIKYQKPIISIGGDHSISYPIIKALKQQNPDLKLIWFDAHLDLKEKLRDNVSHDVVVRQLIKENLFKPEDIYFVGITKIDHDEKEILDKYNFNFYKDDQINDFLDEFEGKAYLSIDIDVLKEELAPGTGYPDGNLTLDKVSNAITRIEYLHADIVEVAPTLDDGSAVSASKKILTQIIESL